VSAVSELLRALAAETSPRVPSQSAGDPVEAGSSSRRRALTWADEKGVEQAAGPDVDLTLANVPFAPGERAAIPAGSLYVQAQAQAPHLAPTRAKALAPAPGSRSIGGEPKCHVAHVERPPRYRLGPPRQRVCAACGALGPAEGQLEFDWDVHCPPGASTLALTCSPTCRTKLGLPERKRR
jgi:hypothetical protein